MKRYFTLLALVTICLLTFNTGCKQDPCKNINCAYSSVCDDGKCLCEIGYEGERCATIARDKFVDDGTYEVDETGTSTPNSKYTCVIERGTRINEVRIKNMRNNVFAGEEIVATTSKDTLSIAPQVRNGYRIEGYGIIKDINPVLGTPFQNASIDMHYTVTHIATNVVDVYGTTDTNQSVWNKN